MRCKGKTENGKRCTHQVIISGYCMGCINKMLRKGKIKIVRSGRI